MWSRDEKSRPSKSPQQRTRTYDRQCNIYELIVLIKNSLTQVCSDNFNGAVKEAWNDIVTDGMVMYPHTDKFL